MTTHTNIQAQNRRRRLNVAALAVAITAGVVVGGCGGNSKSNAPASSTTTSNGGSAVSQTTATQPNACGADVATAVKEHLNRPDVVEVRIVGGCHDVTIATSLDPAAAATGQAICDRATEVAYVGAIKSITVLAANNRELSIGQKDGSCLAER